LYLFRFNKESCYIESKKNAYISVHMYKMMKEARNE